MMIPTELLGWLIETVLTTSALLLLVLLIRKPVALWAGPQWAFLLWLVPALRFLAALVPEKVLAPLVLLDTSWGATLGLAVQSSLENVNQRSSVWLVLLLGVWLIGVAISTGRLIFEHLRLRSQLRSRSTRVDSKTRRLISRRSQDLGMHPGPEGRTLDARYGPAVIGIINPLLILPGDFTKAFSLKQQDLMIQHELMHLSRHDLIWNILASFLQCLFWFNPLARFCEQRFRADQELACDHSVIAAQARLDRRAYGQALLSASQSRVSAAAASFLDEGSLVRRRIRFITHCHQNPLSSMLGLSVLLLFVVWGSTLGIAPSEFDLDSLVSTIIATEPIAFLGRCG